MSNAQSPGPLPMFGERFMLESKQDARLGAGPRSSRFVDQATTEGGRPFFDPPPPPIPAPGGPVSSGTAKVVLTSGSQANPAPPRHTDGAGAAAPTGGVALERGVAHLATHHAGHLIWGERPAPRSFDAGVYAMQCPYTGRVKFGVTTDARGRFGSRATDSPTDLVMVAFVMDADDWYEQEIHDRLAPWRIGGEWFVCSPVVLDQVYRMGGLPLSWDELGCVRGGICV